MSDGAHPEDETHEEQHARALDEARELVSGGMVSELIGDTNRLAHAVTEFATELRAQRTDMAVMKAVRRRDVIGGLLLVIILAGGLLIVIAGNARLADLAAGNADFNRQLVECTTPSPPAGGAVDALDVVHECYENALIERAMARQNIANDTVNAAICARTAGTADTIRRCFRALSTATTTTTTGER